MPETLPNGVVLRDPEDITTLRNDIFTQAKSSLESSFPLKYNGVRIELSDLDYDDPDTVTPQDEKDAILNDRFLARRLRGKLTLFDDTTNEVLDQKERMTLMRVPILHPRGTIIHNGSDYTTAMQARLLPGAYTRVRDNGGIETQFNTKLGTGTAMRVEFEPAEAQYRLKLGDASNLHFYSLLNQIGVPDEALEKTWGPDILGKNRDGFDVRTLDRAYKQVVRQRDQNPAATSEEKAVAVRQALNKAMVSRMAAGKTLPGMFDPKWSDAMRIKKAALDALAKVESTLAQAADDIALLHLRKCAAMGQQDLQEVAAFLNREHQAGLIADAPAEMLEAQILGFVRGDADTGVKALADQMAAEHAAAGGLTPSLEKSAAAQQPSTLEALQEAKRMSDVKRYNAKHAIMSGIMLRHPEEFTIDSEDGDILGVTHAPTGFRMHLPRRIVPAAVAKTAPAPAPTIKSASEQGERVIAVDLDGTLAEHTPGEPFDPEHVGAPIPKMWARVRLAMKDGFKVRIFTARAAEPKNVKFVRKWLIDNGLPDLEITNEKTPDIIEFWDDRAVRVPINSGDTGGESVVETECKGDFTRRLSGMMAAMSKVVKSASAEVRPCLRGWERTGEFPWIASRLEDGYAALVKFAEVDFYKMLEAARKATAPPKSKEQAEAGNYPKGKVRWQGLTLSLENPKGSTRSGVDKNGKKWSVRMRHDYGYIKGTTGCDGDHLDVFVGDMADRCRYIFVVNQTLQEKAQGGLDEHKIMIGFGSRDEATKAYLANYAKGWSRFADVVQMTVKQFLDWIANGDMAKPAPEGGIKRPRNKSAAAAPSLSDLEDDLQDMDDGGETYTPIGVRGLLAASEKLLHVNQGLVPPDNRDSLEFKRIHTPDRLLAERIKLDTTKARRKLVSIAARRRNLKAAIPLMFDDEVQGLIVGNPLSSPLEEINPLQIVSQWRRVTQMGPGGIGSSDAITPDMQAVNASQFGFISPIEGPECFDALTQVYTQDGWVAWPEVNTDMVFACRVDGRLEWHKAERLIKGHFDGKMVLGQNKAMRMMVTPNHRVLNVRARKERIDTAHEAFGKTVRIPSCHKPSAGYKDPEDGTNLVRYFDGIPVAQWMNAPCFEWSIEHRKALYEAQRKRSLSVGALDREDFFTFNLRLARVMEKLAFSLGKSVCIRQEARKINDEPTPVYVVSVSTAGTRTLSRLVDRGKFAAATGPDHWRMVDYQGDVFCATVPGGMLFVRGSRDTYGFWSGNSEKAGIDTRLAWGVKIGSDGKLYQRFRNRKTGQVEWLSHDSVAGRVIALPR